MIASDKYKDSNSKSSRWELKLHSRAASILTFICAHDSNQGWAVVLGCDQLAVYGSQIPLVLDSYCNGDKDMFIALLVKRDRDIQRWVDKNRDLLG